jgi:hypothetical protein
MGAFARRDASEGGGPAFIIIKITQVYARQQF